MSDVSTCDFAAWVQRLRFATKKQQIICQEDVRQHPEPVALVFAGLGNFGDYLQTMFASCCYGI